MCGPSRVPERVDAVGLAHFIIGSLLDFPGSMRAKMGDAVIYEMTERRGRIVEKMMRHVPVPPAARTAPFSSAYVLSIFGSMGGSRAHLGGLAALIDGKVRWLQFKSIQQVFSYTGIQATLAYGVSDEPSLPPLSSTRTPTSNSPAP